MVDSGYIIKCLGIECTSMDDKEKNYTQLSNLWRMPDSVIIGFVPAMRSHAKPCMSLNKHISFSQEKSHGWNERIRGAFE